MPSSFTMYGRQQMLRALLTPTEYTPPASLEIALTHSIPPANATAGQLAEPTAAEYTRRSYEVAATHWAATDFGELYNTVRVDFPQVMSPWGLIAGWAVLDPVSGQCLSVGSVAEPYQSTIGMIPYLDAGTIVLGIYD